MLWLQREHQKPNILCPKTILVLGHKKWFWGIMFFWGFDATQKPQKALWLQCRALLYKRSAVAAVRCAVAAGHGRLRIGVAVAAAGAPLLQNWCCGRSALHGSCTSRLKVGSGAPSEKLCGCSGGVASRIRLSWPIAPPCLQFCRPVAKVLQI